MQATTAHPTSFAWHAEPVEEVLKVLESSRTGLSPGEAQSRLEAVGPNVLPRSGGPSILSLLWRQVNNPLIFVLLGSGALALVMGKGVDGLVVLGVVVLNMLIGFVQEYRAGKAIEALIDLVPENAVVVRGGVQSVVPAAQLVPGDMVLLQAGDRVSADMRLVTVRNLYAEEAALTGESVPAWKAIAPVPVESVLGDRHNMVYSGTLVTAGTATAAVVETAGRTELGRISQMLREATELETPLTQQIASVSKVLTIAIAAVALLLFGVGLLRGYSFIDATLAAITLAVAAIPEGLPAIITIALAIGVQRMARRRAVIRKLPAVETLGATTVICSDKTGTLTRGEMTVQALWVPEAGRFNLSGIGYAPEGALSRESEPVAEAPDELKVLLTSGALCNDASLVQQEGTWSISGDPTEGALLVAAEKVGLRVGGLRGTYARHDIIPFESERQYMATLHVHPEGGRVVYLKGAPEVVTARCYGPDEPDRLRASRVLDQVQILAMKGMRVLAFAAKRLPEDIDGLAEEDVREGFAFLGLQAMIDPPRAEAIDAVAACHAAGIDVKMITGDHRATARAIGHQLGLAGDRDPVFTGEEISAMTDEELGTALRAGRIFARVAPEHKLRLVRGLQEQGEVVAMTGDGVNDAPALKQANIGVAMGITGTAVSKETADMVLADDNFASIAAAVEEGRRVYDNLVKSLAFVLPTNIGEALIILVAVLAFPVVGGTILMPMLPVQILWINLVATVALALPLAFEAMEPGVMQRPPRDPGAPILNRFVAFRTVMVAILMTAGAIILFLYEYNLELSHGVGPELALARAQTVAVTTVVLFQIIYMLQCRSLKDSVLHIGLWTNAWVYIGILLLIVLQLLFVYLKPMHGLFNSAPLDLDAWIKATLAALIVFPVVGLEKKLRRRHDRAVLARKTLEGRQNGHDHPDAGPAGDETRAPAGRRATVS